MQNANGIQALSADEIGYVSGGSVDAEEGSPELGYGGFVRLIIKVVKELSESTAVRNALTAASASTYLTSDTPQQSSPAQPVNSANGTGAVGGPSA
jgi:hypothetical protein